MGGAGGVGVGHGAPRLAAGVLVEWFPGGVGGEVGDRGQQAFGDLARPR
ncbi:MAG TPA: hypothetical protein VHH15_10815 [Actinophytocola sp.]|nr:hypothetical protein [Actinophytocola sp.]